MQCLKDSNALTIPTFAGSPGWFLKLVAGARQSLILIDNWATVETLDLFAKKRKGVNLTIFTSEHYDKKHMPHRKIFPDDGRIFFFRLVS